MLIQKFTSQQKKVFFIFLIATFFNGFVSAAAGFSDIIARKALHAADWQITLYCMIWPVSSFFSIWWGKLLENSGNKSKYFYLVAFLGRLPLLFGFFIGNFYHFIFIFSIMLSFNSIWLPAQNSILQTKFSKKNRGRVFGISVSITNFVTIVFAFFAGRLLDINETYFRYIFLILGATGIIAALLMAGINLKTKVVTKNKLNIKKILLFPVLRTYQLLKTNKPFARFELGFMVYGFGFISIQPAIPKFMVDTLHMNYSQTFLSKSIVFPLIIMIMAPLMGKLHDSKHPSHFCAIGFSGLSLFPLLLLLSSILSKTSVGQTIIFSNYNVSMVVVIFAYILFGIAMSIISIAWNLGSMYFAGNEDASMYQSVHVSLTGIRGLIAPVLGFTIMKTIGTNYLFVLSFLFFISAAYLSLQHYKQR